MFIVVRRRLPDGSRRAPKAARGTEVRYVVRYRLGGRGARVRHGKLPYAARAEGAGALRRRRAAARRVPDLAPLRLVAEVAPARRLGAEAEAFATTRVDVGERTRARYHQTIMRLGSLGEMDPEEIRPADVQAWIAAQADLAPGSIAQYLGVIRQTLDYAQVEPNPARSRRVRLPAREEEETEPPTRAHVEAMLGAISPRYRLHLRLIEGTGLRVGKGLARCAGVTSTCRAGACAWGGGGQSGERRPALRAPSRLVAALDELRPREDRNLTSPLFPGLSDQGLRLAMSGRVGRRVSPTTTRTTCGTATPACSWPPACPSPSSSVWSDTRGPR